jgi:peptide/nickel transport system permease protein
VVRRFSDLQLAFPAILTALLIDGIVRSMLPRELQAEVAVPVLIVAIGLAGWVPFNRGVRAAILAEREKDYVLAARVVGGTPLGIAVRHLLPAVVPLISALATAAFANAVLTEATLSFLGLGIPVTRPSLGALIKVGQEFMLSGEWWIVTFSGATLFALIAALNGAAESLRARFAGRL